MKKLFLFVVAVATVLSFSVYAEKEEGHTSHSRSEIPVITANIDNNVCRSSVSGEYSGNFVVAVQNTAGDTLISHTEAVFDSTQIVTNISSLDDGNYTITYTLEDSTVLGGDFKKE